MQHILIIDDTPEKNVIEKLRARGYYVVVVTTARQALTSLQKEENSPSLDIVFLKRTLPDMDGLEACQRLRMIARTMDTPIIFIIPESHPEKQTHNREAGYQAGAVDYITQPIDLASLLAQLQLYTDREARRKKEVQYLLEETVHSTARIFDGTLVWVLLLNHQSGELSHGAIAIHGSKVHPNDFLNMIYQGQRSFSIREGNNPLTETLYTRTPLLNIPVDGLKAMPGGKPFHDALIAISCGYAGFLPLIITGRPVGVLVLAAMTPDVIENARDRKLIDSLTRQVTAVVNNAHLLLDAGRHEKHLESEQAFQQMVLNTMSDGLIVIDNEARITYINNRLSLITGYGREELYGKSIAILFPEDTRESIVEKLTGKTAATLTFSHDIVTRQGQHVPIVMSHVMTQPRPGQLATEEESSIIVLTDLTEIHQQAKKLEIQKNRFKALREALQTVTSSMSLNEAIDIILNTSLINVNGISARLLLQNPDNEHELVVVAAVGPYLSHTPGRVVSMQGDSPAGQVVRQAKPVLLQDIPDEKASAYKREFATDLLIESLAMVPLILTGEVIGVLEVINKQDDVFDKYDLEILESLGGTAAIAIENARLFEQTRHRLNRMETLLDASEAVSSTLNLTAILERLSRRLMDVLQIERIIITSWDEPKNQFETMAEIVNAHWRTGKGPLHIPEYWPSKKESLLTSRTVITLLDKSEPEYAYLQKAGRTATAMLNAPIRSEGRVHMREHNEGLITLYSLTPGRPFRSVHAMNLINSIGEMEHRLAEKGDPIWYNSDELEMLCQQLLALENVDRVEVGLWHPETKNQHLDLIREVGQTLPGEGREAIIWPLDKFQSMAITFANRVARSFTLSSLNHDPDEQQFLRRNGGQSVLMVPLLIRQKPAGLIKLVDSDSTRVFTEEEISLCQGIANVLGNAIENARLYQALQQRAAALEAAYIELKAADEQKNVLIQTISHEFQTPLMHMLGYASLLSDGAFGNLNTQQTQQLNMVVEKGQKLADLVKNIMRVQASNQAQIHLKSARVTKIIQFAVRNMAGKAMNAGIEIRVDMTADIPDIQADSTQLAEAIEALLDNAIKFSPGSQHVDVHIKGLGMMVEFSVRDYGIGIPADEIDKIFRRFYQIDSSTTRKFGGTGLGLAIVQHVVNAHSGRIRVESEPGKGSCFFVQVPAAEMA